MNEVSWYVIFFIPNSCPGLVCNPQVLTHFIVFVCGKDDLMYCNVHMFYKLKLLNQLTDFNELVPLDICNFLHEIF